MYNEEQIKPILQNAIMNTDSMTAAAKSLGINYKTLKKYALEFDLFKPNPSHKGVIILKLEDIFSNKIEVSRGYLKKRLIDEKILEYKCSGEWCGLSEWMGQKIVLHLDHKNGNRNDNALENLRLLCPNCHSQTDTYCGKGKSSQKKYDNDIVQEKFKNSKNMSQLCKNLGISGGRNQIESIQKKLKELGLAFKNDNNEIESSMFFVKELIKVKREKKVNNNKCKECNSSISKRAEYCKDCIKKVSRKLFRPTYYLLYTEFKQFGYLGTGKIHSVSDNTIKNWMRDYEKENIYISPDGGISAATDMS